MHLDDRVCRMSGEVAERDRTGWRHPDRVAVVLGCRGAQVKVAPPAIHDCGRQWKQVFGPLSRRELALVDGMQQDHVTVAAGKDIVSEGVRSRCLYSVCYGWAVRYQTLRDGSRQILDLLLPGDPVALASIMLGASMHSVQTLTPASFCALNGRKVVALFRVNADLACFMLRSRLEEEHRTDTRVTMLGRMSAEERVGYFLIETFERLRQRGMTNGTKCRFPLRRMDVADAVGLSRVHLMRALRELRSQALVELNGGDMTIPRAAKLAAYAGYTKVVTRIGAGMRV
jgi:CRP-like cAMP-binding protein